MTEGGITPGLGHLAILRLLDSTGLSPWLLGFGCFLVLTIAAVVTLILIGYPDPTMYRNSVAYTAISSFFVIFYFSMGRGWHNDLLEFLRFDRSLEPELSIILPGRRIVLLELLLVCACVAVNLLINETINLQYSTTMFFSVGSFFFIQWLLIVLSADVILRQLLCLSRIVEKIRIDLLSAEIYSTLANVMVRHVGLYIFGLCIISLSHIVFTDGELSGGEMLYLMMPWYLPGLIIISLYLIPYHTFRSRIRSRKMQELNCVASALDGNLASLDHSLLRGEPYPSKIDLLYYQDRIRLIREWPFTDRIRALVLFGILPPLTWVIAALLEVMIEGAI